MVDQIAVRHILRSDLYSPSNSKAVFQNFHLLMGNGLGLDKPICLFVFFMEKQLP